MVRRIGLVVAALWCAAWGLPDGVRAQVAGDPALTRSGITVRTKMVPIKIGDTTIDAVVADTNAARIQGLLGWKSINDSVGMLLDWTYTDRHAIHMQGMRFPIDAVWIDEKNLIRKIYRAIQPNSGRNFPSEHSCRYCLELNAGFCDRHRVKTGQTVHFGVPMKMKFQAP